MAYTNFETKEIHCKVLYFGPQFSGKTENLRSIYRRSSLRLTKDSLQFEEDRASVFEFIPLSIGQLRDFHIKMHIYTLPTHNLYPTFNTVLLRGIDGIVFVADSSLSTLQENINAWRQLREILTAENCNVSALPRVIQYNKRDHAEAIPLATLRHELNPNGLQDIEAIAIKNIGTLETVQKMAGLILDEFGK